MSSMRFFLRTDNPAPLKAFIDESLDFNIDLVRIDPPSALGLSGSGSEGPVNGTNGIRMPIGPASNTVFTFQ
jgi:hypothetical protein